MNPHDDERGGFSLVELVIAVLILTVGVLGLAGTTAYVVRQVDLSRINSERAAAVQTAVEYVRSIPYASVTDDSTVAGRYRVKWEVENSQYQKRLRFITAGPGAATGEGGSTIIASTVVDTFGYRIIEP